MLENLNLRYPTWLSWLGWARKTAMPCSRCNQVVILHPLVRIGKIGNKLNNVRSGFKVKPRSFLCVTLIHMKYVDPGEPQS